LKIWEVVQFSFVAPGFTGCGKTPWRRLNSSSRYPQVIDSTLDHLRIGSLFGAQNAFFRSLLSPALPKLINSIGH
jgi:hypothetical protein